MDPKITVLITCKNEEHNIRACIESARLIADEILVADSGSSDRTLEIVAEMGGCRVVEREFVSYADFKNWSIPQCAHEWVLIIDGDERVTPQLAAEIRKKLADVSDDIDGFWIRRRNFFLGYEIKHSGWATSKVCRLIRRDRCRYLERRVHEKMGVRRERTRVLSNPLLHYTYWTLDQYFEKQIKYTRLRMQDRWEAGARSSALNQLFGPFLRFFQLYVLRLGFLDGVPGIQVCMLQAFFIHFVKQARMWEKAHALPQPLEPPAVGNGDCPAASVPRHAEAPSSHSAPSRVAA